MPISKSVRMEDGQNHMSQISEFFTWGKTAAVCCYILAVCDFSSKFKIGPVQTNSAQFAHTVKAPVSLSVEHTVFKQFFALKSFESCSSFTVSFEWDTNTLWVSWTSKDSVLWMQFCKFGTSTWNSLVFHMKWHSFENFLVLISLACSLSVSFL